MKPWKRNLKLFSSIEFSLDPKVVTAGSIWGGEKKKYSKYVQIDDVSV